MKEQKKIGRPTKKSQKTIDKLIQCFKEDATVEQACLYSGISKETYYTWLKDDPSFLDEMSRAQEYIKVAAKRVLLYAIEKGDEKVALEVIKRREKKRYSERSEHTGADGKDLPVPILQGVLNVHPNDSSQKVIEAE